MSTSDESGLQRWSRLKRVRQKEHPTPSVTPISEPTLESAERVPRPKETATANTTPTSGENWAPSSSPDLPDPTTLGKDDDFTRYLGEQVPAKLRRQALRTLWRSDPVLANLDGLNDYDEDYSAIGTVTKVIESAYRVGKGYTQAPDAEDAGEKEVQRPDTEIASAGTASTANEDDPQVESLQAPAAITPELQPSDQDANATEPHFVKNDAKQKE